MLLSAVQGKKEMKKIFIFLMAICTFTIMLMGCGKNTESDYSTVWPDTGIGAMIAPPESKSVKIWNTSNSDSFFADIICESNTQEETDQICSELIDECVSKGFTEEFVPEEKQKSIDYVAFNEQGYKILISKNTYNPEYCVNIVIKAPKIIGTYSWPLTRNADNLPRPESTKGTIESETSDNFSLCVGDTTYEQFLEYIDELKRIGFEDLETHGEDWVYYTYFDGKNTIGDQISIQYYGHNIMYIDFDAE